MNWRHEFYGMAFSDSEIEQVVGLMDPENISSIRPLDGRRISRRVRDWAIMMGILAWGEWKGQRRLFAATPAFRPVENGLIHIPAEAAWRIFVRQIFRPTGGTDGSSSLSQGKSVAKSTGWGWLNIWHQGNRYGSDDTEQMRTLLAELDRHMYIWFRSAGNIWEITIRDREAYDQAQAGA